MRRPLLRACIATLLSGFAAMFYQLAWVRELSGVTTAASVAMVLVLAAFMAGLGIGAWLGGRLLRGRVQRPLRAYAMAEGAAATLFLLGIPVLAGSLHLQQWLLGWFGPGGALTIQLIVVGLYLVAATTCLGMALPMLIAGLETAPATETLVKNEAAYNLVYGINTLGALVGCIVCGYVTIELVGLHRTIVLGIAMSLASAVVALSLGAATPTAPVEETAKPVVESPIVSPRILAAVFATGAIAVAAEVIWVRMLSLVILNTVYAFTQVLAAVLLGIALAGVIASRIGRRLLKSTDPERSLLRVTFCALLVAAVSMSCAPWLTRELAGTTDFAALAASGRSIRVVVMLIGILVPSSALLAVVLPLLISANRAHDQTQVLSRLFAFNTFGAVAGTLAAGLWILPTFGLGGAQLGLALAAVLVAVLLPGRVFGRRGFVAIAGTAGVVVGLQLVVKLPEDLYALRFEHKELILELEEGVTSDVLVTQDVQQRRRIWINSSWVAGSDGGHGLLGHLPAIGAERVDRALGIALGTGQTFGAVLQHGAKDLDCVEINADVVKLSRRWFAEFNHGLFDHPGVHVHHADGRAFLRTTRETYDVIVLEPLQAWSAGTTALYTREFYEDAKRVLRDGGTLAQWIPFYGQDTAATRSMVRTAIEVFPEASLWMEESDGILLLYQGTFTMPWPKLQRALQPPKLAAQLTQMHLDGNGDILSTFMMGPKGLASWTQGADILEDDRPFLEYAAARQIGLDTTLETLGTTIESLEDPSAYMLPEVRAKFDARPAIAARRASILRRLCPTERFEACVVEIEPDLALRSERLHYEYRQLMLAWANARPERVRREQVLLRGIHHDPDFGEAMVNLAISLAERRQFDAAIVYATKAQAIERTRVKAEALLAKLRTRPE